MASLEELLAREGFKKGKLRTAPRTLVPSRAASMPLHPNGEPKLKKGRTKSDIHYRRTDSAFSGYELGRRGSSVSRLFRSNFDDGGHEIEGSIGRPKAYSSESIDESESGSSEIQEIEDPRARYSKNFEVGRLKSGKEKKFLKFQVRPSFSNSQHSRKRDEPRSLDSPAALDDAAILAVISIAIGYVRRFFKDENFRASINGNCRSCLGITEKKGQYHDGGGVITNLTEAIAAVERVVQDAGDPMELKKASVKLSVITGLSSKELSDKYTSGIPNSNLAACAHIYLSVIYKLQRKEKVAAKHMLQVFCEAPNQARTVLLPGLWDHLFFPHLAHLKTWYEKEIESMRDIKKMKMLGKVYNNTLDMGTYQFANYYKEWLLDDSEAPTLPSIQIPFESFPEISREDHHLLGSESSGSPNPETLVSSQLKTSEKLYESVFRQSMKFEADVGARTREEEEVEEGVEEVQLTRRRRSSGRLRENINSCNHSPKQRIHGEHPVKEDQSADIPDSYASPDADEQKFKDAVRLNSDETGEVDAEYENISSWPNNAVSIRRPTHVSEPKENELALKKLAQAVFQKPELDGQSNDTSANKTNQYSARSPLSDLYQNNLSISRSTGSKKIETVSSNSTSMTDSSAEPFENYEEFDKSCLFSNIPKDFTCPITHQLFTEPVTLETGQTFEAAAIQEWFKKGNKTCPVTGRALECLSVPVTNFLLKRVIDGWKSEYCRNFLVHATEKAGNVINNEYKSKDELALFIIEHLLTNFSIEEETENCRHLISLGGLQFLLRRLELGQLDEKVRVVSLMLQCVRSDGSCRKYLAMNINRSCIIDLLHSKQITARANAVLLLIELICLNRRTAITSFISGLQKDTIVNTMHVLLLYLQTTPPEERVLVAVLLLHLDLMEEPRRYSIYREEAVDSIIIALDCCISENEVLENTQRALLMLGGHFSSSGEILTETWLLKQAGFYDGSNVISTDYDDEVDEIVLGEEEAREREEWLKNVALALLTNGKRSFLEALSKCLDSEEKELVTACLTVTAWLSRALAFLSLKEIHLSAISTIIPRLKECLEDSQQIEHRVLASLSLLNFSKIPECRTQVMTHAKETCNLLESLVEVTWTAEHLYNSIIGEC